MVSILGLHAVFASGTSPLRRLCKGKQEKSKTVAKSKGLTDSHGHRGERPKRESKLAPDVARSKRKDVIASTVALENRWVFSTGSTLTKRRCHDYSGQRKQRKHHNVPV
jgi:hypothetical protein